MYVGEKLIDTAHASAFGLPKMQAQLIRGCMLALLKKHHQFLETTDQQPSFFLEGVPSCINDFKSLKDRFVI